MGFLWLVHADHHKMEFIPKQVIDTSLYALPSCNMLIFCARVAWFAVVFYL